MESEKTKNAISINKRVIAAIIIPVIIIGAVFYALRPKKVQYTNPSIENYQNTVLASGEITPDELITINSESGGRILSLKVQEGDVISKNQKIAQLDAKDLQNTLSEKSADVDAANSNYNAVVTTNYSLAKREVAKLEIELKSLKDDLEKKSALLESGGISKREVDEAKAEADKTALDLEIARIKMQSYASKGSEGRKQASAVAQARASFDASRQDLEKYSIFSPLAGIIVKKYAQEGEFIQAGNPIMDIARTSKRYAEIKIDEKNIGYIKEAQQAYVYPSSNPEMKILSSVSYISPFIDKASGTILAKIEIPKANEQTFLIALTVTVELIKDSYPDSIVIDSNYIVWENNQTYIFIEEDSKALKLPVKLTGSGARVKIEPYKNAETRSEAGSVISKDTRILSPEGLKDGTRVSTKGNGGK